MGSNQTNQPRFLFLRASLVYARQKLKQAPISFGKLLSEHLVGKKHSPAHHIATSFTLMSVGVMISTLGTLVDMYVLHVVFDLFGYLIHGAAGYPLVEFFVKLSEDE